jgi:hypothetical protein
MPPNITVQKFQKKINGIPLPNITSSKWKIYQHKKISLYQTKIENQVPKLNSFHHHLRYKCRPSHQIKSNADLHKLQIIKHLLHNKVRPFKIEVSTLERTIRDLCQATKLPKKQRYEKHILQLHRKNAEMWKNYCAAPRPNGTRSLRYNLIAAG